MSQDVQVTRSSYIESNHNIHVAVVDRTGRLLHAVGDPQRLTFPRSSMKPFQTIPLIESGAADAYGYEDAEISLSCASHSGEPIHRHTVLDVLSRAHLSEDDLQCGTHIPRDGESYRELIREGRELTPVFSNCSGKHSGMLLTAVHLNENTQTYRELEHPHQQRILSVIADVCAFPAEKIGIGVDGCGVPVHRLPLHHVALGFARLAKPEGTVSELRAHALNRIRQGMTQRPEMVAGKKRFDTDLMRVFQGNLVAKVGAEGVQCIGVADLGIGIALKVEDGSERATSVAAMEVLKQLGIGTPEQFAELADYVHAPVLNARQERIGEIKPNFTLQPQQDRHSNPGEPNLELATFAGGCFWCMVTPFEEMPGIHGIVSGYMGGTVEDPTYEQVKTGTTGHYEVVQITFDPKLFSYELLLELYWPQTDPTDGEGQFQDRGTQYKPAIFFHTEAQREAALATRQELADSGRFTQPIVTEVLPAQKFYEAEDYHQDYHKKNPKHYKEDREQSGRDTFIDANWSTTQ